jgi:hypothetical protein
MSFCASVCYKHSRKHIGKGHRTLPSYFLCTIKKMKGLILITFILLINSIGYSQIEICEHKSVMYSVCYKLDTNGTFTYDYSHCTGSLLGSGTYSKSKKSIEFTFDTLQSPQIKRASKNNNGKVIISRYHITDGFAMELEKVEYKGQTYQTDTLRKVTINYSGGPIIVYQYFDKDSLIINPDIDQMDEYFIYWHSPGDTFVKKGKVVKVKKVGNKYKLKEKVLRYNDKKDKYYSCQRIKYYIEKTK